MVVHLAVAGDVFDGVLFLLSFPPRDVFNEIWDKIESVPEIFSTYFYKRWHFLFTLVSNECSVPTLL